MKDCGKRLQTGGRNSRYDPGGHYNETESRIMHTTYRLNANELDEKFIQSLKALFKDKDIEIMVSELDELAYLLRTEANKERLLKAMANVEKGENLVEVKIGDLQ